MHENPISYRKIAIWPSTACQRIADLVSKPFVLLGCLIQAWWRRWSTERTCTSSAPSRVGRLDGFALELNLRHVGGGDEAPWRGRSRGVPERRIALMVVWKSVDHEIVAGEASMYVAVAVWRVDVCIPTQSGLELASAGPTTEVRLWRRRVWRMWRSLRLHLIIVTGTKQRYRNFDQLPCSTT